MLTINPDYFLQIKNICLKETITELWAADTTRFTAKHTDNETGAVAWSIFIVVNEAVRYVAMCPVKPLCFDAQVRL